MKLGKLLFGGAVVGGLGYVAKRLLDHEPPPPAAPARVGAVLSDDVTANYGNLIHDAETKRDRPFLKWEKGWGASDLYYDVLQPAARTVIDAYTAKLGGALFDATSDAIAGKADRDKLIMERGALLKAYNSSDTPLLALCRVLIDDLKERLRAKWGNAKNQARYKALGINIDALTIDSFIAFILQGRWDDENKIYAYVALLTLVCAQYGLPAYVAAIKPRWRAPDAHSPALVQGIMAQLRATAPAAKVGALL